MNWPLALAFVAQYASFECAVRAGAAAREDEVRAHALLTVGILMTCVAAAMLVLSQNPECWS